MERPRDLTRIEPQLAEPPPLLSNLPMAIQQLAATEPRLARFAPADPQETLRFHQLSQAYAQRLLQQAESCEGPLPLTTLLDRRLQLDVPHQNGVAAVAAAAARPITAEEEDGTDTAAAAGEGTGWDAGSGANAVAVNPAQYERIMKRRQARSKLEAHGLIPARPKVPLVPKG